MLMKRALAMHGLRAISVAAALTTVGAAAGESVFTWLEPVEQGVGDINDLGVSLRHVEEGLAMPSGFKQVYRVRNQEDLYVRASGAVYAAFPQSVYARYRTGQVPQIPASTVFHIGAPPEWMEPEGGPRPRPETLVDDRIDLQIPAEQPDLRVQPRRPAPPRVTPAEAIVSLPPIVGDAGYRSRRWMELLTAAANP